MIDAEILQIVKEIKEKYAEKTDSITISATGKVEVKVYGSAETTEAQETLANRAVGLRKLTEDKVKEVSGN